MPKLNITRFTVIKVPLEKAYQTVRDFRQWLTWSPWLISEPDCILNYAEDGKSYDWDGKVIGSGSLAITNEILNERIDYRLNFLKPWKSTSDVSFTFSGNQEQVEVTWTMNGSLPFFMFWMKSMMEALVGMDYQRGLLMLKDYLETGSVPSKLDISGAQEIEGFPYIGIKSNCAIADIGPSMERDFQKLEDWIKESGVQPSGPAFSIYHKWDLVKGQGSYTSGFSLESMPEGLPSEFTSGQLPSCQAFVIKHTGPYHHLGNAWSAGMGRAQNKIFAENKRIAPFEFYENHPKEVAENDLVTSVCFPIKG
ncbi:MAG: GyrI-like domain-containing protein [Verrucomicrobiota bacterium]